MVVSTIILGFICFTVNTLNLKLFLLQGLTARTKMCAALAYHDAFDCLFAAWARLSSPPVNDQFAEEFPWLSVGLAVRFIIERRTAAGDRCRQHRSNGRIQT